MESPPPAKKNLWVSLIIAPVMILVVVALIQLLVHFGTPSTGLTAVVNILSVILGFAAVILLILIPVWIVMLVKNDGAGTKSRNTAVILALIFGLFTWLYTYEKDSTKFWVNLVLSIITLGLWAFIAWIWAIFDTIFKPDEFYEHYNQAR